MQRKEYKARVTNITDGPHGLYAVADPEDKSIKGSITFSLRKSAGVWQDNGYPEIGDGVVLSDLRERSGGWRACQARFFTPDDV